jgi:hypothetical protein
VNNLTAWLSAVLFVSRYASSGFESLVALSNAFRHCPQLSKASVQMREIKPKAVPVHTMTA